MIRPYKPEDKATLLKIFTANIPKYFAEKEINDFENYLELNAVTYLTIEVGNTIVGGTGYYINETDSSGRITWIFFNPSYAGLGLGRKSVEHCLNVLAKDNRVEKLIVRTSQLAYKFFEKFGFRITRFAKDYWGEGLDLYEMEMVIN